MRKRTLQDWASIAEIVGAVAVVVSLIYVAFQIRDNTRALVSNSRQELAAQDMVYLSSVLDPTVLAVAQAKFVTGETLTDVEFSQLAERQHLNFRIFENAYYQYTIGVLEESQWKRYSEIIGQVICEAPASDMWARLRGGFTEAFRDVVEVSIQHCAE